MNSPAPFGDYTRAKLDYLAHAQRMMALDNETHQGSIAVNIKWCRPLHPYGMRMVRDGFFTLSRRGGTGRKSSAKRMSFLTITEEGLAELSRLQRRARKAAKRHQ